MTVACIALLPRPTAGDLGGSLPRATEAHHCPPFAWPVSLYRDSGGRTWVEWECQVCGAVMDVPAALEDFGLAEAALRGAAAVDRSPVEIGGGRDA